MKVYLIKASAGSVYSKYKADTGGPPQNIFSAAGTTPSHIEIEMCDETIGMKTDFNSTADIIAIFMSTPDALRAYEIADKFSLQGKTIVLGGLHTHFMKEEASEHADAILLGEIEGIWEQLLNDFQKGTLKESYQRDTVFDLKDLKPYPTHIIHPRRYDYTWSVVVSRGCPFKCDFCLVHKFFKNYQLRPIENIVSELKALKIIGVEWVELHSDNLTQDKEYAIALFEAIAPLKMNFFGETTIMIARDERLLAAAQKAGVKTLLFGIETPSEKALKDQGKAFVKPNKVKEYVKIIKSYGIEVVGDFLFGFDAHDINIFQETLSFVRDIKADKVYPHLVIPFPGSDTFKKLNDEGRILTRDWSKYEGSNAVFQPKLMSPKELEEGLWWFWYENSSLIDKVKYMFN
ncbi:radical SAM protein [uncultured Winogradskyella sp.]|uniref:B12-binding domain-containing radical SAM protein n=1 Tax=uncultured Winogradskyella sp. TaxID=395353 RepID=UPI0030D80B05|tara:strand:- start:3614 stop:4825 length:1212 start_codon:yes stop_codon:yes gene_type:complete